MKSAVACLIFTLGLVVGVFARPTPKPEPLTGVQTSFTCNDGGVSVDCGQYVLEIDTQRGFGRFALYQVQGAPLDTSAYSRVSSGNPLTYQAAEPDPRGAYTFTVSASEP